MKLPSPGRQDLPITVVAGYLGSGKTTLINRWLMNDAGIRYAVLVNDFGDLNIDVNLIDRRSARSISLTNGCVCCSLGVDVDAAFDEIRGLGDRIDWVLLEASGVADPTRLSSMVMNVPGFSLYETLTLVDVTRIKRLLKDKFIGSHIRQQLVLAENIHYSKVDLIEAAEFTALQDWVGRFNAANSHDLNPVLHPRFYAVCLRQNQSIKQAELTTWLSDLPESLVRIKGFVEIESELLILQGLDGNWQLDRVADDSMPDDANPGGQLLLISKVPIASLIPPVGFELIRRADLEAGLV